MSQISMFKQPIDDGIYDAYFKSRRSGVPEASTVSSDPQPKPPKTGNKDIDTKTNNT